MPVAVSNPATSIWNNRIKHHQKKSVTLPSIASSSSSSSSCQIPMTTTTAQRQQQNKKQQQHSKLQTGHLKGKVNVLPNLHSVNTTWNNDTKSMRSSLKKDTKTKENSLNSDTKPKKTLLKQATFEDKRGSRSSQASRVSRASNAHNKAGILAAAHSSAPLGNVKSEQSRAAFNKQRRKTSAAPTSFNAMKKAQERMVARLMEIFPLDEDLIRNVVAYTQMLPKFDRLCIDLTVFNALLADRFSMTNTHVAVNLFRALETQKVSWASASNKCANEAGPHHDIVRKEDEGYIDVETCASFFCILLSEDTVLQANMVFNVFDFTRSETMEKSDLEYVMIPMFGNDVSKPLYMFRGHTEIIDEVETEDNQKFMLQTVFNKLDINGDGIIERNEFITLCEEDKQLLAVFGPLLPQSDTVYTFRAMLENKTPFVIKSQYRNERQRLLKQRKPNQSYIQSLYPIELEGL